MGPRPCVIATVLLVAMGCRDQPPRAVEPRPDTPARSARSFGSGDAVRAALDSVNSVASDLYARGEYDSARVSYGAALDLAAALGDSASVARTLTWLGLAAWRLADYREARRLGEQALAMKHRLGLEADLFRSYNALGLLSKDEGALETAVAMYDSAFAIAQARRDSLNIAKVLSNRALVDYELGNLAGARTGYLGARDIARARADSITEWNATVGLASVDVRLGDPLGAIAGVTQLRQRHPRPNHPVGEENAYAQLGTAYDLLGERQRAIAALDTAIQIAHDADLSVQESEDLKLLAEIYEAVGDRRRALGLLEQAYVIDSAVGAPAQTADVLLRRATVLGVIGHAARARESVGRALAIHRRLGARLEILTDLLADAELAARSGDTAAARSQLHGANALADSVGVAVAKYAVAVSTARVADRVGDSGTVLSMLDSARFASAAVVDADGWEVHALMARAHRRLGQFAKAIVYGRQAVAGVERMRASLGAGELRTALVADKADVYADLVLALIEADRPGEALEVADRSRSRALLDHLSAARLRESDTAATSALIAERARVLTRIDAILRRLSTTPDGRPRERGLPTSVTPSLSAELAALRREYDELMVRYPGFGSPNVRLGNERPDINAVRAVLRDDEALLEFFVTASRTFVFVVTRTEIAVVSAAVPYNALVERVRLARDLAAYRGVPDSATKRSRDAVFQALHHDLVAPALVSGRLDNVSRLIIVPHGALSYLPFAVLQAPSGRALVEDFSLLYLPVAGALPTLRSNARFAHTFPTRVVALAPFPRPLVRSPGEAKRAAAASPGSIVLEGSSASERALRDALEEGAIVHLASHGVMETESPMFSRVAVARGSDSPRDDGRLEVHELLTFRVKSPLVFLSGCETGSAVSWSSRYIRAGDDVTLEQAFLYAGAKTVIATRWRVEDASAAALADRFYVHLAAYDAVDALALAQRDMILSTAFRDVHYWAAYAVSGSGTFRIGPSLSSLVSPKAGR